MHFSVPLLRNLKSQNGCCEKLSACKSSFLFLLKASGALKPKGLCQHFAAKKLFTLSNIDYFLELNNLLQPHFRTHFSIGPPTAASLPSVFMLGSLSTSTPSLATVQRLSCPTPHPLLPADSLRDVYPQAFRCAGYLNALSSLKFALLLQQLLLLSLQTSLRGGGGIGMQTSKITKEDHEKQGQLPGVTI